MKAALAHTPVLALTMLMAASAAHGQASPTPLPAFDVASVRQNKTNGPQHSNVPLDSGNVYSTLSPQDSRTAAGGFLVAIHQPLWRYITFAYHLSGTQELALRFSYFSGLPKSGAPDWVTGSFTAPAEFFDIEARAAPGTTLDQMRLMMQALLAERFHFALHRQTAEAPVFALVLVHPGVSGPNLRPHPATDVCPPDKPPVASAPPQASPVTHSPVGDLPPVCGVIAHVPSTKNPRSSFGGRAVPLSLLATSLPTMTGMAAVPRPVVDQTGLAGLYDFTLNWSQSSDPETGDAAASFRQALKDQLGLELRPTRAPIDVLIIDHVEHPTDN
jgi:uncharacterized protein (TIGR03435 family)